MAMLPRPHFLHDLPTDAILFHTSFKVAQALSLTVPPIYITTCIVARARGRPHGFTINKFLRATWISSTVGAIAAAPIAWQLKIKNESKAAMLDRYHRLRHNVSFPQPDSLYLFLLTQR